MIPFILDLLTIFFIVASSVLLWLNLRTWRRPATPNAPLHEELPVEIPPADIRTPREEAEKCVKQAEQAVSQLDKESWLRMADEWTRLVEDAERSRSDQ